MRSESKARPCSLIGHFFGVGENVGLYSNVYISRTTCIILYMSATSSTREGRYTGILSEEAICILVSGLSTSAALRRTSGT